MQRITARAGTEVTAGGREDLGDDRGTPGHHLAKAPSWDFGEGTIGRRFGGKSVVAAAAVGAGAAGVGQGQGRGRTRGDGSGAALAGEVSSGGGDGGGGGGREGAALGRDEERRGRGRELEGLPYGGTIRMALSRGGGGGPGGADGLYSESENSSESSAFTGSESRRGSEASLEQVGGTDAARGGGGGAGGRVGDAGALARSTPSIASVLSPAAAAAAAGSGGGSGGGGRKGGGTVAAAAAAARVTAALAELEAAAPGACVALLVDAIERLAGPASGGEPSLRGARDRARALFGGGGGGGGGAAHTAGCGTGGTGAEAGGGGARSVLGDFLLARWQQDLKPPPPHLHTR
jgi:hypothetical protein